MRALLPPKIFPKKFFFFLNFFVKLRTAFQMEVFSPACFFLSLKKIVGCNQQFNQLAFRKFQKNFTLWTPHPIWLDHCSAWRLYFSNSSFCALVRLPISLPLMDRTPFCKANSLKSRRSDGSPLQKTKSGKDDKVCVNSSAHHFSSNAARGTRELYYTVTKAIQWPGNHGKNLNFVLIAI